MKDKKSRKGVLRTVIAFVVIFVGFGFTGSEHFWLNALVDIIIFIALIVMFWGLAVLASGRPDLVDGGKTKKEGETK